VVSTAQDLRERFREDRLGLSASSLTFDHHRAGAVLHGGLALFTAFPIFGAAGQPADLAGQSLVPESISRGCWAT
jgi:membrane protein